MLWAWAPGRAWASVMVSWRDGRCLVSTVGDLWGALHPEDPRAGMTWVRLGLWGRFGEGEFLRQSWAGKTPL